jgi:hypothetical protein
VKLKLNINVEDWRVNIVIVQIRAMKKICSKSGVSRKKD